MSIQEEIDDQDISALTDEVTSLVRERNIRGVVIDLHQVEVVDTYLAHHLSSLVSTLKALRAQTIISGLSVPVVVSLLEFGISLQAFECALDVEQAIEKLRKKLI